MNIEDSREVEHVHAETYEDACWEEVQLVRGIEEEEDDNYIDSCWDTHLQMNEDLVSRETCRWRDEFDIANSPHYRIICCEFVVLPF